jgi:hypothetical protein
MRSPTFVALLLIALPIPLYPQLMKQQAQEAIRRPIKVDVAPVGQVNPAGRPVAVQVLLRDGEGKPATGAQSIDVELMATQPSGQISKTVVTFAPGETSKQVEVPLSEAGLTKLSVRQVNEQLLGSTNYVVVASDADQIGKSKVKKSNRRKKVTGTVKKNNSKLHLDNQGAHVPRLIFAAYADQSPNEPSAYELTSSAPMLMLKVSGENDAEGIRADGVAYARVQIFYMGPEPPRRDIQVWVSWTNGDINSNPIVIQKNQLVGEAHWISKSPIPTARLLIAGTNPPNLPFAGSKEATVTFGEPILGIGFANPPKKITIVDNVTLTAMFFDAAGNPIPTAKKRMYRFVSNSPILRLKPDHAEVEPGNAEFSTMVVPTYLGDSQIEAFTPGYQPVILKMTVTGLGVLLICVIGGMLGGLLAYINSQGKLWVRIVTGIIVGMVASWAYVFLGLPNTQAMILHTQISVLFVSILAAFAGVRVFSTITKALNLGF